MELWRRLRPEGWPVPPEAFPSDAALVGGAVRDALLNRLEAQPDLDLVVAGDAIALCRQLSQRHGGCAVVLDAERSIARLAVRGWSVDLARREGPSLEADLGRRDYTINAMALPLAADSALVDPTGGLEHLRAGQLVAVSEANLLDDPLRLLRGLRLSAQLGFALEPQTWQWIQRHHGAIGAVAGERVLAELEKLAAAPDGHNALAQALGCGLLRSWSDTPSPPQALQELTPERARAAGLSEAEQELALPLARMAAVLDGMALGLLRSSRQWQQRVDRLRHWQQRLDISAAGAAAAAAGLPEAERLALHRQLEADLPALLIRWPAGAAQAWLQRWRDPDDPLFHPRPAIDGHSLQRELGLRPSRELGVLLEHLALERAFGRLQSRNEALRLAQNWIQSEGSGSEAAPRRD